MALKSHEARKLAIAGVAAMALAGAAATPAQALTPTPVPPTPIATAMITPAPTPVPTPEVGSATFQCTFPLVGAQPLRVSTFPGGPNPGVRVGEPSAPIDIRVTAPPSNSAALQIIGVRSVEGTVATTTRVTAPGLDQTFPVSQAIPRYTIPTELGELDFIARDVVPSVVFPQPGNAASRIESIKLNLVGRNAAGAPLLLPPVGVDSDGNPETFDVDCVLSPPNQLRTLAYYPVIGPATPTPTPTPEPTVVEYGYNLSGAATLKTLTKGNVPLSGSIDAQLTLPSSVFTADLKLNPTTAKLTTLGFLPITAKVEFVSAGYTGGTLTDGVLSSNSKVRIKLPQVSLFGVPLAGGANCQTKTASNIALKSTGGAFDPLVGGNLAGTFAISDLTGCGFLTGLVSPLTAGKGNAIALKLTPKTLPTPTPTPTPTPIVTPTPVVTPTPTPKPGPKLTLTYQCTYPLIGAQPLSVFIEADIPSSVPLGVPTGAFEINATATASGNTYAGISLIGAATIEGVAKAESTVKLPGGFNLPVTVPMTVDKYTVPATPGDLVLTAFGSTPSLTFASPGVAPITVDSIKLNLIARNAAGNPIALPPVGVDSDGNPDTFDVACVLSPAGQDTTLTTITLLS